MVRSICIKGRALSCCTLLRMMRAVEVQAVMQMARMMFHTLASRKATRMMVRGREGSAMATLVTCMMIWSVHPPK